MTWKEIQPAEAKEGDRVRLGEKTFPIEVAGEDNILIRYEHGTMWANGFLLTVLGAVFEREVEDHPHGLIPAKRGAVIRIGEYVFENHDAKWAQIGVEALFSHETVQMCSELNGFEVLWPKQPTEITEEMVETGAREVDPAAWDEGQWQRGGRRGAIPETEGAHAARSEARGIARAVLSAVLGTPGDVSTEHVRDHLGICNRCGEGLSGLAVVDGEAPCSGGIRDA